MTDLVTYTVEGGVATVTLDSPANRNALSMSLTEQLTERLARAAADEAVRAVVLTHTGTSFCAGGDLSEATSRGLSIEEASAAGTRAMLALMRQILELPKPVVARLNGHARAGGLGLLGACDVVIAGERSTFALTEVRLGLAPAMITLTLRPRVAPRALNRYYLTGEKFDAATAEQIGLITEAVASDDELEATVTAILGDLRKGSPQGLRESKRLVTAPVLAHFDTEGESLAALSGSLFASDEAREGMMAFLQKTTPRWAET
ncbi:enoyl-CoA hydratase family protein [Williamsia sterculiae]|uniref:Enoyl-CoA hydratase n=1 Tax=Williamsia sterculiae TaxID=1344003 RepID=A0A1N7GPP4_9NOCA|nr:enoyl-CoA hydratase family protein [Williamsia sterculiae]SIS14565.1 enoyl-CoA hydratase [Williamsia sterculiae]